MGKGSPRILAVASPDPVLSVIGPLALGVAAGSALVVDLAAHGARSLADMVTEGPALHELAPGRSGVAVLPGGGLDRPGAETLVSRLSSNWPAIVVRPGAEGWDGPTVPVLPLLPGRLAPVDTGAAVWQRVAGGSRPSGPGPVLPRLSRRVVSSMLHGTVPAASRWIRAWGPVWSLPWA